MRTMTTSSRSPSVGEPYDEHASPDAGYDDLADHDDHADHDHALGRRALRRVTAFASMPATSIMRDHDDHADLRSCLGRRAPPTSTLLLDAGYDDAGSNQVSEQVANDSATPLSEQVDTGGDSLRRREKRLSTCRGRAPRRNGRVMQFDFDGDQVACRTSLLEILFVLAFSRRSPNR